MSYLWYCAVLLANFIFGASDGHNVTYPTCVIGAGYSGLAAARYLKEYNVNFKVLEATRYIGGTWRFDPHVGTDEDGLPVFTSMYKNLRMNNPRQTFEYAGFPFPDGTPSYPSSTCVYRYLNNFTKTFDLEQHIQFRSLVTIIKCAGDHWNVTYYRTDSKVNQTEKCGFLIIATGQYRKPVMPTFPGQDTFRGKIIHSHDYRDAEDYRGRRVLLLGAGASGLDLATQLANITTKLVHSHHLNYTQPYFGANYVKKPDILSFTADGVIFNDNSFEEVDEAIFCTGYDYDHSYLDKSCGVTVTSKFILPLYRHVVNINHLNMAFVGVSNRVIGRVRDAQGQYAAALAAKKFTLPPVEAMLKSWLDQVHRLPKKPNPLANINVIGHENDNYFANLTAEAGVIRAPPVLSKIKDHANRFKDLLNYRDYEYKLLNDEHFERRYNKKNHTCPIL